MATQEDFQKSSSMPSTPQSFLYETDSPFLLSGNDDVWPSSKRRRIQQRPSNDTQFIHMNGYKSDSQLGTRFNNTYVDSYSDSKTVENSQTKSADAVSVPEDTSSPVLETAAKVSDEPLEVSSARSVRCARKAPERSTETSSRVLKVKSGAGSSQPTNIQTFIFKTKLDPRQFSYRDRSDEPGTPSSAAENSEVKLDISPAESTKRMQTRKTRKYDPTTLKFKSYTPNATPTLRQNSSARGTSRPEISVESESPAPTTVADDRVSQGFVEQDNHQSPEQTTEYTTPTKEPDTTKESNAMETTDEVGSTQRRSTRARKPARTTLLEETPQKKSTRDSVSNLSATRPTRATTKPAITGAIEPATRELSSTVQSELNHLSSEIYDAYGSTPSPDGLSNKRSSGRLRKPTIKAIEALQSKPHGRKRQRHSDQSLTSLASAEAHSSDRGEISPDHDGIMNTTFVPESRSNSKGGSDTASVETNEVDTLSRQLYDLASFAISDGAAGEDNEEAKLAAWREAFNKKHVKSQELVEGDKEMANTEAVQEQTSATKFLENLNLPGEINSEVPLDHPSQPRPWTEDDGWIHTGRVNQHGEEYCVAPADKYQWVKHASNYKTPVGPIPTPPPLIKSIDEIRRDNIYGFPPSPGQRNLYQRHPGQIWKHENITGLVNQTPNHTKSLRSADRSAAKQQVDAMNVDDSGMKTRYIHKRGFPRFKRPLKIVFVDSSKIEKPDPQADTHDQSTSLRKGRRRQSVPNFTTDSKSTLADVKTPGSDKRKRSLEVMASGTPQASGNNADQTVQSQSQRKKRQSTTTMTTKVDENKSTPGRSSCKRQPAPPSSAGNKSGNHNHHATPVSTKLMGIKSSKATTSKGSTSGSGGRMEKISLKFHIGSRPS